MMKRVLSLSRESCARSSDCSSLISALAWEMVEDGGTRGKRRIMIHYGYSATMIKGGKRSEKVTEKEEASAERGESWDGRSRDGSRPISRSEPSRFLERRTRAE